MKKIIAQTNNITKKDSINAYSAIALKSIKGEVIHIARCAVMEDIDKETGETKEVGYLVSDKGEAYSCISGTVISIIYDIIDLIDDGEEVSVIVNSGVSNAGREYLTLSIV